MSDQLPRRKVTDVVVSTHNPVPIESQNVIGSFKTNSIGQTVATLWQSEGHAVNRKTGKYSSGGPFHQTTSGYFSNPGQLNNVVNRGDGCTKKYSGPCWIAIPSSGTAFDDFSIAVPSESNESSMNSDGATAISQCAPTNPTASLASTLAETFREGVPSLPGIQSWKKRTEILRAAGSEYLNYQFGWAPLQAEVHSVVNAARYHRDVMQNYRHNEGRDVHRRFDFPTDVSHSSEEIGEARPTSGGLSQSFFVVGAGTASKRTVSVKTERKRWFEGCFTYGGPSKTDSFGRAIGFGSEADAVYGLSLSPDVLWDLTPWSWAVDWFSNAGDVIHNVTNFALAGLVMRYGYMMEETISTCTHEWGDSLVYHSSTMKKGDTTHVYHTREGAGSNGKFSITKSRVPANPFGFGVGWEGLSPTQLAITAAIGITRSL